MTVLKVLILCTNINYFKRNTKKIEEEKHHE